MLEVDRSTLSSPEGGGGLTDAARGNGVSYCDQLENRSSVPGDPSGPAGRSAVAHWTLYLQYYIAAHVHTHTGACTRVLMHTKLPRMLVGTRDSAVLPGPRGRLGMGG